MMVRMEALEAPAAPTSVTTDPIVRLDLVGTIAFVVSAVLAAVVFTNVVKVVAVVVALVLFAIGVFCFLWSYWIAVQRSREDEIAVAQLYFLTGEPTPRPVKRALNGLLLIQVAVALGTAIARSSTDGHAGSTLAFGILVPMFGLGINGLWCARHGRFAPRQRREETATVPDSHDEMEQNSPHG